MTLKELYSTLPKGSNSWPFRIKLTTNHMCWDTPKISPSKEFQEHILGNMNEASHKSLDEWIPVETSRFYADMRETYPVKLAKKESFWFERTPFYDKKPRKEKLYPKAAMMKQPCYI